MGRMDDAAKRKVVELRKAGLSFRKIKAVLELENIKVSAQAIYLYLREFQGRSPGRARALVAGNSSLQAHMLPQAGAIQDNWNNIHFQNLLLEASQHPGFTPASNFNHQTLTNTDTGAKPSGSGKAGGGSRPDQQHAGDKEENDIQIISVTSLAQYNQQKSSQPTVTKANTGTVSSAAYGAAVRRRVTPSPATNSMLAARRRLLDKALSQKMKSFQQMASLLRKDHPGVQGPSTAPQPETYDLTNEKTVVEGQPGGAAAPRRFLAQRAVPPVRPLHPPPRVGFRLPNRSSSPLTSSAPGVTVSYLQTPGSQGAPRSEANQSPQQAVQDAGVRGGLLDQIKTLGTEVHSLGLAVKMLVEQQCRLEREQVQQTHIQKQILSTLQSFASKIGNCSSGHQPQNKTPSPSNMQVSASASFGQDTFTFSQAAYSQCSQTEPSFSSLESLEHTQDFKLPSLSPSSMNGFPSCSNANDLPLTHTPTQTQTYTSAFSQQSSSQGLMPTYTQSYGPTFNHSHPQTFRAAETKTSDFTSSCSARSLQDCSQPLMDPEQAPQDQQISIIKVEGP